MAAGQIADLTSIAPSSLSFHLKELSHAGLIGARPQGRYVIYSANFAAIEPLPARQAAFEQAFQHLHQRITAFVVLPLQTMTRQQIISAARRIHEQAPR